MPADAALLASSAAQLQLQLVWTPLVYVRRHQWPILDKSA